MNVYKFHISKLDVAKRQLETAITLYFHNADPVSVHTLTGAAYDVLHDLCKVRNIKPFVKNTDLVREEKKKEYVDMINAAQNFFKHADKDPEGIYEFRPQTTDFFIWDACQMYQKITTEIPKLLFIYSVWFYSQHPDLINYELAKQVLLEAKQYSELQSRAHFFQEMSAAYDRTSQFGAYKN